MKLGPFSDSLKTYTPHFIASPFFESLRVSGPDFFVSAQSSADVLFDKQNPEFRYCPSVVFFFLHLGFFTQFCVFLLFFDLVFESCYLEEGYSIPQR